MHFSLFQAELLVHSGFDKTLHPHPSSSASTPTQNSAGSASNQTNYGSSKKLVSLILYVVSISSSDCSKVPTEGQSSN